MLSIYKKSIVLVNLIIVLLCSTTSFARMAVSRDFTGMRNEPKVGSAVVWLAEKYYPVIVLERKDRWSKIKDFENEIAWVYTDAINNIRSVITLPKTVNIHQQPTVASAVVFIAERGVPLKVCATKDNWIKVQHMDGDIGWVYKTLVW